MFSCWLLQLSNVHAVVSIGVNLQPVLCHLELVSLVKLTFAMHCRGKALASTLNVSSSSSTTSEPETCSSAIDSTTVALDLAQHAEQALNEDKSALSKHQKKQRKAAQKKSGGKQSKAADNRYISLLGLTAAAC